MDLQVLAGLSVSAFDWFGEHWSWVTQGTPMIGGAAGAWSWWQGRRKERRATLPYFQMTATMDDKHPTVCQMRLKVRNRADDHLILHDMRIIAPVGGCFVSFGSSGVVKMDVKNMGPTLSFELLDLTAKGDDFSDDRRTHRYWIARSVAVAWPPLPSFLPPSAPSSDDPNRTRSMWSSLISWCQRSSSTLRQAPPQPALEIELTFLLQAIQDQPIKVRLITMPIKATSKKT